MGDPVAVGDQMVVEVGDVAHGGHCVARVGPEHGGLVAFVRHALPGERVRIAVTEIGKGGRYVRADAVEVLQPAAGRVDPPCPWSGPGRCGGCDWQHADLHLQRELKARVVTEQFARLAQIDLTEQLGSPLTVEPVPGDAEGLRWRTRVELAVDGSGRPGLRAHRSHQVVPIDDCLIATDEVVGSGILGQRWTGERAVDVVASSTGDLAIVPVPTGERLAPPVTERVQVPAGERHTSWSGEFEVAARGFWQVHPGAAATFVAAVLDGLEPRRGERVVDLYSGVGLFAAALAAAVGEEGQVLAVEGDRVAVGHAGANLAGAPGAPVEVRAGAVDRVLAPLVRQGITADLVVLDPPRAGAGRRVVAAVAALQPRRVAYVACDPAALARDVSWVEELGYGLTALRAFDAFPMTHHVECVALLTKTRLHRLRRGGTK